MTTDLLDIKEAARLLRITPSDVGRLRQQRKLRGIRSADGWKFLRRDVEAYARRVKASAVATTVVPANEVAVSDRSSKYIQGVRMNVSVPNRPEGAGSKSLARVIRRVSERASFSPGVIELVLTLLAEEITAEVRRGHAVLIRGWLKIGSRSYKTQRDAHSIAVPFIVPSRGFRQEVRYALAATNTTETTMRRYQKANRTGSIPGRVGQRVFSSQERERERLKNDPTQSLELD